MKNIKTNRLDKEKLIECYKQNGNAVLTGKIFGISSPTVLKIIRSYNIPVNKKYKDYTDEEIISKYNELGTVEKVSKELHLRDYRINKVLERNNIERKKIRHIEIGDVFNKLTIIKFIGHKVSSGGNKVKIFLCECECGRTREVKSNSLTTTIKPIKDCGCGWELIRENWKIKLKEIEENKNKKLKEIEEKKKRQEIEENKKRQEIEENKKRQEIEERFKIGSKYSRLTILSETFVGNSKILTVQCECGVIKNIKKNTIHRTKSCGCLQIERSKRHGLASKNDIYKRNWYDRWRSMIKRCYNPKIKSYRNYGARGITVCDRWREPNGVGCKNYIDDIHNILGPQPSTEHSLDRINNNGIYEITNLRWATHSEQSKNQRRNIK